MRPLPGKLEKLRGGLIVSCQANPDSPLRDSYIIRQMALAAIKGGADALRIQSFDDVQAVRAVTDLPIIGLTKTDRDDTDIYITPTSAEAVKLTELGSDIVALDATKLPRPEPLKDMIDAIHAAGALVMADISTLDEAQNAYGLGVDIVGTTMAGYTPHSRQLSGPDWELMQELSAAGLPFIAEGRLNSPADAQKALELGAFAVVVGSAITRPDVITSWFSDAVHAQRP